MTRTRSPLFTATALLVLTSAAARAQANATINAVATVSRQITVVGAADLRFGEVLPGTSRAVGSQDPDAGAFRVQGVDGLLFSIDYTLPTNLASGTDLLPIGSWTAWGSHACSQTAGFFLITPPGRSIPAFDSREQLCVYIGATVTAALAQPNGTYTAPLVLTVNYF